ncbi:MAG: GTP cyclohydrolase, partial [Gemmatimonadaceae bacterium]|nr:GTP cyclohydrolase [Acetobacteraceae bacterium]
MLGNQSVVAVQRAVSELRAGRPVLLDWSGGPVLVAAADTLSPRLFTSFRAMPGATLVLTAERSAALGAASEGAVVLPLAGL